MTEDLYDIVRFFRGQLDSQIVLENVSLEEAQAHCNREDSHGDGWFDGYRLREDDTTD